MRRVILLVLLLSTMLCIPRLSAELLTLESIVAGIDSTSWYSGSNVKEFVLAVGQAYEEEMKRTAEEAAAAAVRPVLLERDSLLAQNDVLKKRANMYGGLALGFGAVTILGLFGLALSVIH